VWRVKENFAPLWNAAMHVKVAFVVFTRRT